MCNKAEGRHSLVGKTGSWVVYMQMVVAILHLVRWKVVYTRSKSFAPGVKLTPSGYATSNLSTMFFNFPCHEQSSRVRHPFHHLWLAVENSKVVDLHAKSGFMCFIVNDWG